MQKQNLFAFISAISILSSELHKASAEENHPTTSCSRPSGHHLYEKEKTCPIGGGSYQALILGTHSTFGQYLDFTKVSYLPFPIPVPVCPDNGFVDFQKEYTPEELKDLKATLESEEYKALIGKHTSWYLLARLIEMSEFDGFDQWWLDNRAAAEASTCQLDTYNSYAEIALKSSDAALNQTSPDEKDFWAIKLNSINLLRRLGRFEEATDRLIQLQETPENYSSYVSTLRAAIEKKNSDRVRLGEFDTEK